MCLRSKPYLVDLRVGTEETGSDQKEQLVWAGAEIQSRIAGIEMGSAIAMLIDPDGEPIRVLEEAERG